MALRQRPEHGVCFNASTMKRLLLGLSLVATAAFAAEPHPGYGVVKLVDRIAAKESATAGASKPSSRRYLVKVRLDDGSTQVRTVKGPHKLKAGDRVLVTNAGDVVRDYQYSQSGSERGSVAPGTAPDGARPQDGAIQGGSILPGERDGVPHEAQGKALERCAEMQGRLRDQCLLKEEQQRSSVERAAAAESPLVLQASSSTDNRCGRSRRSRRGTARGSRASSPG
jgi:hypothetical protein